MFQGSIPALVTPFSDGELDPGTLEALVDWQIAEGSTGLVPVGTTGESPTLSHAEHERVVEIVVKAAAGRVPVMRLPYFPEAVTGELADLEHLVLVGARRPVSFFAYPGQTSDLVPPLCRVVELAGEGHDLGGTLSWLAELLTTGPATPAVAPRQMPDSPRGTLTPETVAAAVRVRKPSTHPRMKGWLAWRASWLPPQTMK